MQVPLMIKDLFLRRYGSRYSTMDQLKFVEDSLSKIWKCDMVCLSNIRRSWSYHFLVCIIVKTNSSWQIFRIKNSESFYENVRAEFLFFLILVYRPTIFRKSTFWRLFTWNCLKIVRTVCIYKVLIMDFLVANPLSFCYSSILKMKSLSPCLSFLTLSWRRPLSYRNQSIDLLCNGLVSIMITAPVMKELNAYPYLEAFQISAIELSCENK